jgi:predicted Rossmann fold nucleotide-binding protein DprA/Smf involved in DNA uptake
MSDYQQKVFREFLIRFGPKIVSFSHGCCRGADIEAHQIVREVLGQKVHISVYPSTARTRAPIPQDADYVHKRLGPLQRNQLIVDCGSGLLFAAPLQTNEVQRSGTWATVRYARRLGMTIVIAPRTVRDLPKAGAQIPKLPG